MQNNKENNTNQKYIVKSSGIHGNGTFAKKTLNKNEDIGVGIDFYLGMVPFVTPEFGSLINHSYCPNCYLRYKNGKWYVSASKKIPEESEILLDYRKTPWYIMGPESHYK